MTLTDMTLSDAAGAADAADAASDRAPICSQWGERLPISAINLDVNIDEVSAIRSRAATWHGGQRISAMPSYTAFEGLRAYGAQTPPGRLAGFICGMPADPEWWWTRKIQAVLAQTRQDYVLRDALIVLELHILPYFQRAGLGSRLLRTLCHDTAAHQIVLTTIDRPTTAMAFYQKQGFTTLARAVPFADHTYAIMGAQWRSEMP